MRVYCPCFKGRVVVRFRGGTFRLHAEPMQVRQGRSARGEGPHTEGKRRSGVTSTGEEKMKSAREAESRTRGSDKRRNTGCTLVTLTERRAPRGPKWGEVGRVANSGLGVTLELTRRPLAGRGGCHRDSGIGLPRTRNRHQSEAERTKGVRSERKYDTPGLKGVLRTSRRARRGTG